jgi:ArsR family transcriptional regulator, arsenate/arsenite/antimonite-responsive transcriptional repressor
MKATAAVAALSASPHEHWLAVFRLLVEAGAEGLSAGTVAEKLGLVPSSLTIHTQALRRAGLIGYRRVSRQVFYAADFESTNALVG